MNRASNRQPAEALREALHHLHLVVEYSTGDISSQLTIDAICMRLSAAIETLERLDASCRHDLFGAEWAAMWGMRNRIAHGYILVDEDIIRATVAHDVPTIITRIEDQLDANTPESQ